MIDYAHRLLANNAPFVYVDDEGTPAEDAVLIKQYPLSLCITRSRPTFGCAGNAVLMLIQTSR